MKLEKDVIKEIACKTCSHMISITISEADVQAGEKPMKCDKCGTEYRMQLAVVNNNFRHALENCVLNWLKEQESKTAREVYANQYAVIDDLFGIAFSSCSSNAGMFARDKAQYLENFRDLVNKFSGDMTALIDKFEKDENDPFTLMQRVGVNESLDTALERIKSEVRNAH